jgi:hypothetical protein
VIATSSVLGLYTVRLYRVATPLLIIPPLTPFTATTVPVTPSE